MFLIVGLAAFIVYSIALSVLFYLIGFDRGEDSGFYRAATTRHYPELRQPDDYRP